MRRHLLSLLVLLLLLGSATLTSGCALIDSVVPGSPTHAPTATPQPTPSNPEVVTMATLGGTQDAFAAYYPYATDSYGNRSSTEDQPVFTTHVDGYSLWIGLSFTTGTDGKQHVSEVFVSNMFRRCS